MGGTFNAQQFRLSLTHRTSLVNQALDSAPGGSDEDRIQAVLDALEKGGLFLIVQDIYPIETARYAHIVLPAAQWGEMDLTSINGERRLRLYQKFMDPPGVAEPDWKIMAMMARKLQALYQAEGSHDRGCRFSDFDWQTEEEVFRAAAEGVEEARKRIMARPPMPCSNSWEPTESRLPSKKYEVAVCPQARSVSMKILADSDSFRHPGRAFPLNCNN